MGEIDEQILKRNSPNKLNVKKIAIDLIMPPSSCISSSECANILSNLRLIDPQKRLFSRLLDDKSIDDL